jgi:hypothetical protein
VADIANLQEPPMVKAVKITFYATYKIFNLEINAKLAMRLA